MNIVANSYSWEFLPNKNFHDDVAKVGSDDLSTFAHFYEST